VLVLLLKTPVKIVKVVCHCGDHSKVIILISAAVSIYFNVLQLNLNLIQVSFVLRHDAAPLGLSRKNGKVSHTAAKT
jgi:hypothetical protein